MKIKNIFFIIFSLLCITLAAQSSEKKSPLLNITLNPMGGYSHFVGNNAFADSYKGGLSWGAEMSFSFSFFKQLSFGVGYHKNYYHSKSSDYFGTFDSAKYHISGFFLKYRIPINDEFSFAPQIGFYSFDGFNDFDNYKKQEISGSNVIISPELEYRLSPRLGLFARGSYQFLSSEIQTDSKVRNHYKNANEISTNIGLRVYIN
ncbi:hypothetical protein EDM00_00365 [Ornithobacterium rhinotracheale]|uniref:hypothetical protein n=1 Tax=Ornithobacterium rhinotracheale TaxID=28251 RepID=UPI00129C186D|nr:hypothetical protein [Ornithobacterium rhinotracheale]MRI62452.1 hypothetical protein [Ornithobacterium rhinotracheale]